ncbi:hypothetical protein [Pseudomonas sp. C11]|jgi:hypothetical protein|uniref:hypothetical protein n=1 Tax=Pseudomonas sp. C11 TaxID=3075550 RepID=UPI002AFF2458|nr:hypothetical protein [Pseudomonas sp. C11]
MCTSNLLRDLFGEPVHCAGALAIGDQHKTCRMMAGAAIVQSNADPYKKLWSKKNGLLQVMGL